MSHQQLEAIARAALGSGRGLAGVTPLRGGSKKSVNRLTFDDGSTAIAYLWDAKGNYWPVSETAGAFGHASGLGPFECAHARLTALGIRVPRVYLADNSRDRYPADFAIVEDVAGGSLEALLRRDPRGAEPALTRLADMIGVLHREREHSFGKLAHPDSGGSCEQVVLARALTDLAEAAARDHRIAAASGRLEEALRGLAAAVRPRTEYGLVHSELGPDHVLLDADGDPVLIDIEGLMAFDVEWEHVFLRIRFGEHYRWLRADGLDEDRLALYLLAMRLSLVAGPLRLLDGDFPDRDVMTAIAEHNLREALLHR